MAGAGAEAGAKRLLWLVLIFVAEIVALAALYQFAAEIECQKTDAAATCEAVKSLVARALVVFAAGALVWYARPLAAWRFAGAVAARRAPLPWVLVHLAGLGLAAVPLILAWGADLGAIFATALPFWLLGAVLAAAGGLMVMAAPGDWRDLLLKDGPALPVVFALAFVLPDLAELALPLWDSPALTTLTFKAVALFLSAFSDAVTSDPAAYVIGVAAFAVHIARQCSGVEGFALVTGFVALYAFVFRADLRVGRFVALVLPLALMLSWLLNVVRIGTLILIGAHVSPEVAVNGFHSYAGWLFFTLLAVGLTVLVQTIPWLHRRPGVVAEARPLRRDPVAAAILPFVAFMFVSTLVGALAPHPEFGYPVKVLVLLPVVLFFWPVWRGMGWPADLRSAAMAVAAGLAVGVVWVMTAPAPDDLAELLIATMTTASFASWVVLRLLGTVVLVPLVEEAFFRGYLLPRLMGNGAARQAAAILLSSMLFGLLHGRVGVATAAGVVFALVRLGSGRTGDAVVAHLVANLLIALVALWQGEWNLI